MPGSTNTDATASAGAAASAPRSRSKASYRAVVNPNRATMLYRFCRYSTMLLSSLLFGYRTRGAHHVPRDGAALLVANHQSFLDPPLIGIGIPGRPIHFVARLSLFKSGMFGALISALNAEPIRQNEPDTVAIRRTIEKLRAGACVMVFPEGTRSPTGEMDTFKRGTAVLIRKARCPVIPVAIDGAFECWPRTRRLPRLFGPGVLVCYGQPIPAQAFEGISPDEALTMIEQRVRGLLAEIRSERSE